MAHSPFQVSVDPPVWLLDTPGVLPPNMAGGWLTSLRLGTLDLMRHEIAGTEPLAAFLLHHLALTENPVLEQWPTVSEYVRRAPEDFGWDR